MISLVNVIPYILLVGGLRERRQVFEQEKSKFACEQGLFEGEGRF